MADTIPIEVQGRQRHFTRTPRWRLSRGETSIPMPISLSHVGRSRVRRGVRDRRPLKSTGRSRDGSCDECFPSSGGVRSLQIDASEHRSSSEADRQRPDSGFGSCIERPGRTSVCRCKTPRCDGRAAPRRRSDSHGFGRPGPHRGVRYGRRRHGRARKSAVVDSFPGVNLAATRPTASWRPVWSRLRPST
jgi:hypothetical protein